MSDRSTMGDVAVQGPIAREIVQAVADSPLPERMTTDRCGLGGEQVLVCGTGYTGEDGVELLCSPEQAPQLWHELVRRGADRPGSARVTRCVWSLLPPLRERAVR